MFSEIQQHFDALEDQRKNILSHLQHYDEEQLLFKPDSMKWSISQVVNHLILTEQSAVNYMNKKNKAERLPRLNWIAYLRIILLKIALVLPLKFKAPSEVVIPKSNRPLSELITEWEAVRNQIYQFLENLPRERTDVVIFRHPIAGYFTIYQTLEFFKTHIEHHLKQIHRISREAGFSLSFDKNVE